MASFLFLTWNGGGATVPVTAIAGELLRRGHHVRVLGHSVQEPQFAEAGIPFAAYPRAGGFEVKATPLNLLTLTLDRRAARDVDDELSERPVDLVVGDVLLLSTLKTLYRRGQRYALLESTTDTLMRVRLRRFGRVLWFLGLPVRKILDGADTVVVASVAELDPKAEADAEHVGPMVAAVEARSVRPTLLMSLSTFPFPRLKDSWQRLLNAVDGVSARVIATTGPSLDPAELDAPPNVELHGWADHAELMVQATAVVTHGGHGTTIAALAHGVPVLVLPLDTGSDQPGIGRIVAQAGVGIALPPGASAERLQAAVERLLHDEGLRQRARELGERIRSYGGRRTGAELLIRAAEHN
ncbi:glycosyltransferase [Glutamicibacter sp. MNS18]|uniref:glycosyltransferase n=1 Tax=Glutamicibacter sp. MNS18 TaxID=2989817 RepID=UPI002235F66B|nr:glycosyltransferase [Glutamicibacter sp. MNS18]MCW4465153.1 glycosyltransferase [Glutamicibacter sp. MNS18]